MDAVGVYLQQCRKQAGFTQEDVAKKLGVVGRTVSDWEVGRQVPGFDLMAQFIQIVGARAEDVQRLMLDKTATAEDGRRLADRILTQGERDWLLALADTDERRAILLRRVWELTNDPQLRARIQGYLDGLEVG